MDAGLQAARAFSSRNAVGAAWMARGVVDVDDELHITG
jgi:hypothetical protein